MGDANFNGTSVAGEHIGDRQSENLAALISSEATELVGGLVLVAAAEAGNARAVSVQAKTAGGRDLAQSVRLYCRVYDENMDVVDATVATLAASGGATSVTATGQAAGLIDTGEDGAGVITVGDATTALAGDLVLGVSVAGRAGIEAFEILTFA